MFQEIKNLYRISKNVVTAGQPTAEQFQSIKEGNFDVVINLAETDSPDAIANEADIVESLGLDYVHIPVDFKEPTLSDLKKFFATMDRYRNNNIFIHCACNWRVSVFMFLYRAVRCDVPVDTAIKDQQIVWKPDEVWQSFIDYVLDHYNLEH